VTAGTHPNAVAVDPVTNKIYVANFASNDVTVINGVDNSATPVPVGTGPFTVVVNPVTNRIYVAISANNTVTVIDSSDNSPTSVVAGTAHSAVAVNPVTNKIYVANLGSIDVTVIDGIDNSTTTVPGLADPTAMAVNLVTNKIYMASLNIGNMTVITPVRTEDNPLTTTITLSSGDRTTQPSPIFTFTAKSDYNPIKPPVQQIYYQVDTCRGSGCLLALPGPLPADRRRPCSPGCKPFLPLRLMGRMPPRSTPVEAAVPIRARSRPITFFSPLITSYSCP
jgi:YVTN family beta-propeller protein